MKFYNDLLVFFLFIVTNNIASGHAPELVLTELSGDDIVAVVNEQSYSLDELRILLSLHDAESPREWNVEDLVTAARNQAGYGSVAAEAVRHGVRLAQEDKALIDKRAHDFARKLWYRKNVLQASKRPGLKDLRELYELKKEDLFLGRERVLFEYAMVSREGTETILQKAVEEYHGDISLRQLFKELSPESEIIVKSGESVADLPVELQPLLQKLYDNELSPVIQTDQGEAILLRVMTIEPAPLAFDSALEDLYILYNEMARRERLLSLIRPLAFDESIMELNKRNVLRRGLFPSGSDVLVQIGEQTFDRESIRELGGWNFSSEVPQSFPLYREKLLELGPVQDALTEILVNGSEIHSHPLVSFYRKALEEILLARRYAVEETEAAKNGTPEEFLSCRIEQESSAIEVETILHLTH